MEIIEALYRQDPFWVWLGVASTFIALNLATGSPLLMWPGVAGALIAVAYIFHFPISLDVSALVFLGLLVVFYAGVFFSLPKAAVADGAAVVRSRRPKAGEAMGRMEQTGALVGRIARANGEFNNGVGRVWIDEAEWGAELDGGGDTLPDGEPVRVTKVIGGIRLKVRPLHV